MIIDNSSVNMNAEHSFNQEKELRELLHLYTANGYQAMDANGQPVNSLEWEENDVPLSNEEQQQVMANPGQALAGTAFEGFGQRLQTAMDRARQAGETLGLGTDAAGNPLLPGTTGLDPSLLQGIPNLGTENPLPSFNDPLGLLANTQGIGETQDPLESPEVKAAQMKHDQIMAFIDSLVKNIMERIKGKSADTGDNADASPISSFFTENMQTGVEAAGGMESLFGQMNPAAGMANSIMTQIGVKYERTEIITESESSQFTANGTVKTADGREIDFNVDLAMNRETVEMTHESLDMTMLIDPIVLNYDGNAVDLADQKFSFDLNADGVEESIHGVAAGSGILVFDKNKDGIANDGSELFGPTSGQGFAELSELDQDGNDWIDEADGAWDQLMLWSQNEAGEHIYQSLADAGVGAIHTGSVATPFTIKHQGDDQARGVVTRSGVFLKEDGEAGSAQEINLVV